MTLVRTYSADQVSALVEILRNGGDISHSELIGMKMLVTILKSHEAVAKQDVLGGAEYPVLALRGT